MSRLPPAIRRLELARSGEDCCVPAINQLEEWKLASYTDKRLKTSHVFFAGASKGHASLFFLFSSFFSFLHSLFSGQYRLCCTGRTGATPSSLWCTFVRLTCPQVRQHISKYPHKPKHRPHFRGNHRRDWKTSNCQGT